MIIMFVVVMIVYVSNGWFVVILIDVSISFVRVFSWFVIFVSEVSLINLKEVGERLIKMCELLEIYGYMEYFYVKGKFVILNNGIEFLVIYFVMLLSLFFLGGGCYFSFDYWFVRNCIKFFIVSEYKW